MKIPFDTPWADFLKTETTKPYFKSLEDFVDREYAENICYPPKDQIFTAFEACSPDQVKVVIIGQDPYHGPNQAHGLCFSVNDWIPFPPSLRNIFKEVSADTGAPIPLTGNLTRWAEQGVLLLNATLTVRHGQAGSHQGKGWETFTDAVIDYVSTNTSNVVFLLWGSYAKNKCRKVDVTKHLILESCHPSPLSAIRQKWFGNHHFSRANEYLIAHGKEPIVW